MEMTVTVFSCGQSLTYLIFVSCDVLEIDYLSDPTLQFTLCRQ